MSGVDLKYLVPHRLDDPPRFLWWDMDVAMLAMTGMVIGIMTAQMLLFSGLGFAAAASYQKVKAGRHRAFGLHALYWHLPFSFGFKVTPPSAVREFVG